MELFLLGRYLMRIGERSIPRPPGRHNPDGTRAALLVLCDVVEHPGSTIGSIAHRTLLPQSQVSAAVSRLREAGSVDAVEDAGDRRRTVIEPATQASDRVDEVRSSGIDAVVAEILPDPDQAAEVLDALATLSRHIPPRA